MFKEVPVCSQILQIGHLLVIFNSSVNFLVYTFGNSTIILRYFIMISISFYQIDYGAQVSLPTCEEIKH